MVDYVTYIFLTNIYYLWFLDCNHSNWSEVKFEISVWLLLASPCWLEILSSFHAAVGHLYFILWKLFMSFCPFFKRWIYFYLSDRVTEKEEKTRRKRSSIYYLALQMTTMDQYETRNKKFPHGHKHLRTWTIFYWLSRHIGRGMDWDWSSWDSNHYLYGISVLQEEG